MALLPSESGLSQANYEALQLKTDSYTFNLIAEQQNLDFSAFSVGGFAATGYTDALIMGAYLFRSADATIVRISLADGTYTPIHPAAPTGLVPLSTYSLTANAGTLYVFAATATGVQMNSTANNGLSWAGWTVIFATTPTVSYGSNVAVSGLAAASSRYSVVYGAAGAFDEDDTTFWATPYNTTTGWLSYDFGVGITRVVARYKVGGSGGPTSPKNWTFQGSNDNTAWTTLDTRTNNTAWATGEARVFSFTNTVAYRYYRLNITANNGMNQLQIGQLRMYETSLDQPIILVAAANYRRIHFVLVDNINKLYTLFVTQWNGSGWQTISSSHHLTDRPYNLSVTTRDNIDMLLLETNIPGRGIETLVNNVLVSKRLKAGGLMVFHYRFNSVTWSTHYEVEILDELSLFAFMRYSHISNLNGIYHVTAWVGAGTADHPTTGLFDYSSADGIHWSTPNRMYFGSQQSSYGFLLLQSGEYAYAVEYGRVWRSLSTQFTGYTAATLKEDITALVSEWSYANNDLAQLSLLLDNGDYYFTNHRFINPANKLLFTLKFGSYVSGAELLYPLGLFEMDDWAIGENIPEHMIQISARDYMGRMVEKVASFKAKVYSNYLLGMDDFQPKTDGNYSGLSHLYTVSGQIDNGDLLSATFSNGAGLGFSTFRDDIWNGEISCGIRMSDTAGKAGLVFRGKSANVYWRFQYVRSTDKVELEYINSPYAISNILYQSPALSWTASISTTVHFLRVRFLYGLINLFTSADGVIWEALPEYNMNVMFKQAYDVNKFSEPYTFTDPCERGHVGIIGFSGGVNAITYITQLRINDFNLPLTVEDAFQTYAAFSRIYGTQFNNQLAAGDTMWASPTGVTVNTGLATGYYDQVAYDGALYG